MLTILLLVIGLLIDAYSFSNRKTTYVDTHHVRCSHNQIIYCKYFTISKIATLTCHTYRVMYVAVSPDGQTIVTGAGDETVRFWNVFPSMKTQVDQRSGFGRTASAFSSAPLDAPTADHQVRLYSLKITRISSQLKLLQKLLCLPLYMNLKRRELV
ncbi:unnamed protein product [Brassica rapa]|uniref:Anaphase-promoting complex subunit 4 WD40 domain-containing protein n=1 Tax=Brassica campestris TaxID=3711 RepID=A0A8D9HM21_BRACM|nr:unnamed protein product [Brassica rapa]CAG7901934.1 unnamed protein product [Brassica rapa]